LASNFVKERVKETKLRVENNTDAKIGGTANARVQGTGFVVYITVLACRATLMGSLCVE